MMVCKRVVLGIFAVLVAGSSTASVKLYDASAHNGLAGDERRLTVDLCPPIDTTLGSLQGFAELEDAGLGTVTLQGLDDVSNNLVDVGSDLLTPLFGPGAFVFIDVAVTRFLASPNLSNGSGVGAHGPSISAPGGSVEWGVISGWQITGANFCVSSPIEVCNENGFGHGVTLAAALPSSTYNLGTWNFDLGGDYEASWYIRVTSNGGLSNNQERLRGALVGASLPALPLAGLAALVGGLALSGLRHATRRSGPSSSPD